MHAFLIIGNNSQDLKARSEELGKKLKAKILEFPLIKIEDVRNLSNLIKLSFNEPTLIVSENVHEATDEALNAFLKNLEEPQENIYFALTAPSVKKVIPTIASRCQIIKLAPGKLVIKSEDVKHFLDLSVGEKLKYVDKIKDRGEAIALITDVVNYLHRLIHTGKVKVENIEAAIKTLTNLRANGNVTLQLANFVISLV